MNNAKLVSTEHLKTVLPIINNKIDKIDDKIDKIDSDLQATKESIPSAQVQSSWSQNDETAIDYIKDRTHYSYEGRSVLFPKTELNHRDRNEIFYNNIFSPLEIDSKVIVYCDDKEYECSINYTQVDQLIYTYIGNLYIRDQGSSVENTEEPFVIFKTTDANGKIYFENTEVAHTIEILDFNISTQYIPLDENYIPTNIARITDIPKDILLYGEQALEESQLMQARKNMDIYNMELETIYSHGTTISFKGKGDYCEASLQFPDLIDGEIYRLKGEKYIAYGFCNGDITSDTYTMLFYESNLQYNNKILFEYTNGILRLNVPIQNGVYTLVNNLTLSRVINVTDVPDVFIPSTIQRTSMVLAQANINSANESYSPTEDTDLTTKVYVDSIIPTDDEVLEMLAETGIVEPAANNGYILTDANGVIYSI